jgi:hypothetical protein
MTSPSKVNLDNMEIDYEILCRRSVDGERFVSNYTAVSDTLNGAYSEANKRNEATKTNDKTSDLALQNKILEYNSLPIFLQNSDLCKELSTNYAILTGDGTDKEYRFLTEGEWKTEIIKAGNDPKNFPFLVYPIADTGQTGDKNIASDGMFLEDAIYKKSLLKCQYIMASGSKNEEFHKNILTVQETYLKRQLARIAIQEAYEKVLNETVGYKKEQNVKTLNDLKDAYIDDFLKDDPKLYNLGTLTDEGKALRVKLLKEMDYMDITDPYEARTITRRLSRTRAAIESMDLNPDKNDEYIKALRNAQTENKNRNPFIRFLSAASNITVKIVDKPGKIFNNFLHNTFTNSPKTRDCIRALFPFSMSGAGGNDKKGVVWAIFTTALKLLIPGLLIGLTFAFPPAALGLGIAAAILSIPSLISTFRNIVAGVRDMLDRNRSTQINLKEQMEALNAQRTLIAADLEKIEKKEEKQSLDFSNIVDLYGDPKGHTLISKTALHDKTCASVADGGPMKFKSENTTYFIWNKDASDDKSRDLTARPHKVELSNGICISTITGDDTNIPHNLRSIRDNDDPDIQEYIEQKVGDTKYRSPEDIKLIVQKAQNQIELR